MATDLKLMLEDHPGALAQLGEALGAAGVNIDGGCAVTGGGQGEVHVLTADGGAARSAIEAAGMMVAGQREVLVVDADNQPGELGMAARKLADAGVNIELFYIAGGAKLVFGVDDMEKARAAL